jgi:TonB family protein
MGLFMTTRTDASAGTAMARASSVSAAGFGAASAGPTSPGKNGAPRSAGFSEIAAAQPTQHTMTRHPVVASTPVEILHKPRPAYTDEARRMQIEGEVVVEAVFSATGEVRVLRVLRGLGHGLDESAVKSAEAIRFRAATQNGSPVDTIATVRISFQLAY